MLRGIINLTITAAIPVHVESVVAVVGVVASVVEIVMHFEESRS